MNRKSLIVPLGMAELDIKRVIMAVDEFDDVISLDKKESNSIRLIAEEILGVTAAIFEITDGQLWIEENDGKVEVHVSTSTMLSDGTKEKVQKLSENGNEAYKGMSGLLKRVVDLMKNSFSAANPVLLSEGSIAAEMSAGYIYTSQTMNECLEWNMQKAEELMRLDEKADTWDELELSVLKKLSENILVSYRADCVDITIITKVRIA